MYRFWLRSPLRDAADDKPEGGGGGDPTKDAPPPLTLDAIKELITGAIGGFDKKYSKQFKAIEDKLSAAIPPAKPGAPDDDDGSGGDDGKDGKDKKRPDPAIVAKLSAQERSIAELTKRVDRAEAAEQAAERKARETLKGAAIDRIIGEYRFVNPSSRKMFRDTIAAQVKFAEDGEALVAETAAGDVPFDHFIRDQITAAPNLLEALPAPGAGAKGGKPPSKGGFDIDNIKPGMSTEDKARAMAEIRKALGV